MEMSRLSRDSDSIDVVAPDLEYPDDLDEEYQQQILALQALSSPSKRDSLDEGYDPNETLRCVVYDDGQKVDILRDSDIEEEVDQTDFGRQIEEQLNKQNYAKSQESFEVENGEKSPQKVGDFELLEYEEEPKSQHTEKYEILEYDDEPKVRFVDMDRSTAKGANSFDSDQAVCDVLLDKKQVSFDDEIMSKSPEKALKRMSAVDSVTSEDSDDVVYREIMRHAVADQSSLDDVEDEIFQSMSIGSVTSSERTYKSLAAAKNRPTTSKPSGRTKPQSFDSNDAIAAELLKSPAKTSSPEVEKLSTTGTEDSNADFPLNPGSSPIHYPNEVLFLPPSLTRRPPSAKPSISSHDRLLQHCSNRSGKCSCSVSASSSAFLSTNHVIRLFQLLENYLKHGQNKLKTNVFLKLSPPPNLANRSGTSLKMKQMLLIKVQM